MAKGKSVSKRGLIFILVLLLVVGGGFALFFILKPKADLKASYQNTYELVHNQDYSYIKTRNEKIEQVLKNDLTDVSNETKAQTIAEITIYNPISGILSQTDEFLLKNLMFAQDKDGKMASLQSNIKKTYQNIKDNIAECKQYLETYLTNNQISQYANNEAVYQKIYNYKTFYKKLADNVSKYYEYMSQIVNNYLYDTIEVNSYSKMEITVTCSWARKVTEFYINYNQEEIDEYNFNVSLSKLQTFITNHSNEDGMFYLNNKQDCDKLVKSFANLNFEDCIKALATTSYAEYINTLLGEAKEDAELLKTYFGM